MPVSRGGAIYELLYRLDWLAKQNKMMPAEATLMYVPPPDSNTAPRIDVYVGRRQVQFYESHDFIPRFTPGMRKTDVETVLRAVVRAFEAMPAQPPRKVEVGGWDGN